MEPMMYLSLSNDSPFLCHYGVPRRSGRYKWGSGDRPYQSMEGQGLTRREKRQMAKAEKAARQKAVADATAERQKAIYEQERERVLRNGSSAISALKYSSTYNNQELRAIIDRIEMTRKLEKLSADERKTFIKKVDNVMNGLNKAASYGDTIMKTASTAKRFMDMFGKDEEKKKQAYTAAARSSATQKKKEKEGS